MNTAIVSAKKVKALKNSKEKGFWHQVNKNRILLIMLLPAVIYFIIFEYLPLSGLVVVFKNFNYRDGLFMSPWAGPENFRFFFMSGKSWAVTQNYIRLFCSNRIRVNVCVASGPWGWRNQDLMLAFENGLPNYNKLKEDYIKAQKYIPMLSFALKTDNIKNELAALKDVNEQYANSLTARLMLDVEEGMKILTEKQKAAGIEKVKEEILKQYDEYLKNFK